MINELYSLSKALDSKGITATEWHRKYKEIPKVTVKSPCMRIWLNDDGSVYEMESLSSDHANTLRKFGDNQSSFPGFNISPLYRIIDSNIIAELSKMESGQIPIDVTKLKLWCAENNWLKKTSSQIYRSMIDCPEKLFELLSQDVRVKDCIIYKLFDLCKKICNDSVDRFYESLKKSAFDKLNKGEDIATNLALLFHKGSVEKEHCNDTGARLSVILDVKNWQPYNYPVASEQTTIFFNELLLANLNTNKTLFDSEQIDAFGSSFMNPNEPMPSVKLSGFDVALRSMFNGQPCQYRYGLIDDGSYPVSLDNRSLVKKSLEWIADPSRRQITWEKIDKNEMAFIYPSKLPDVPPKFISIFSKNVSENSGKLKSRFENAAQEFAKAFQGLPPNQSPDTMHIFTLRKIDKARSKVIFTHNSTPEQLIQAADDWSLGCSNLPELDLGELETPFPLEIANIINAVWKQNGERADGKSTVKRMKYYQSMELLLDILPQSAIKNFLHIQLENAFGLINYLGNQIHRGERKGNNSDAAQIYSVLGLLLYKCNIKKENYMEEFAYLLGQLLHVSDELHTMYCMVKRNKDIPPQLAGSALFVSACEMPYQALSQLSIRMNPYTSWAKQYRHMDISKKDEESWRAGWLLSIFCQLSDKISPLMNPSIRFGDYEKAQLFIGYMASLPKKEKPENTTENDEITGGIDNEQ